METMTPSFAPHYALYPHTYFAPRYDAKSYEAASLEAKTQSIPLINRIDGDLGKKEWKNVPWQRELFDDIRGPNDDSVPEGDRPPAGCTTKFKMIWDDEYLYIGAVLHSPNRTVVTTFKERNEPIFQQDSDFEVFLDPAGSCHLYKELELNAWNTVWNLYLDKPYDDNGSEHSGRVAKNASDPRYWDVKNQRTATKLLSGKLNDKNGAVWSIEMALSHHDSLSKYTKSEVSKYWPEAGKRWKINFSRVEEKGRLNWTWCPQIVWDPSSKEFRGKVAMHLPDAWGYINFVETIEEEQSQTTMDVTKNGADLTWPHRLAAMNLYYAQRSFKLENGRYASSMGQIDHLFNKNITGPFDIALQYISEGDRYIAFVKQGGIRAIVNNERLLTVQDLNESFVASSNAANDAL